MKKSKSTTFFTEIADVRDGLFPALRCALAQMHVMNDENDGKFRNSGSVAKNVAKKLQTNVEEVYEALVNATYPRCEIPLVDGHGNMGFPSADMDFSEMHVSAFYEKITGNEEYDDFSCPLSMPIPYVLSNGTMWGKNNTTKIPSHNLNEIIDAVVALIIDPNLETKDLMKYIKGPDFLIGGMIINQDELCEIYEKGCGVIELKVTPETINSRIDEVSDFCDWYNFELRKNTLKEEQTILIRYNAFLFDGKTAKFMSLKEILQKYIEYYKSVESDMTNEDLCNKLNGFKEFAGNRITKILK